jgi:hypothetical protein
MFLTNVKVVSNMRAPLGPITWFLHVHLVGSTTVAFALIGDASRQLYEFVKISVSIDDHDVPNMPQFDQCNDVSGAFSS